MRIIGKRIDVSEIKNSLVQGEQKSVIKIELPRMYDELDITQFAFKILAKLSDGTIISQTLEKIVGDEIVLTWTVTNEFTAVDGITYIEIWGTHEDTLIKFVGEPIYIKKTEVRA